MSTAGWGLPYSSAWNWLPGVGPYDPTGALVAANVAAAGRVRDTDALEAIADALRSVGQFADVLVGAISATQAAEQVVPRATIRRTGFKEDSRGDPEWRVRTVTFTVTIAADSDELLARLSDMVQDLVAGQSLGGFTLPALTDLADGKVNQLTYPEVSITLTGSFAYLIEGYTGHTQTGT